MMTANPNELVLIKTLATNCRDAFEAWLNPDVLRRFIMPMEGTTLAEADVDDRVGGRFSFLMKVGEQSIPHSGEYLEISRYRRLAFTWNSASAGSNSVVTLDFEEVTPHQTRLTLRHNGLPSEPARQAHVGGWSSILEELGSVFVD